MASPNIKEVKDLLNNRLEEVCRHLLPGGTTKNGAYLIGDVHGAPGKSMSIKLNGSNRGVCNDFAEQGDGFDVIELWAKNRSIPIGGRNGDASVMSEACQFLGLTHESLSVKPKKIPQKGLGSLSGSEWHQKFKDRKISDDVLRKYGIRLFTDKDAINRSKNEHFVAFPFKTRDKELVRIKAEGLNLVDGKKEYNGSSTPYSTLFGWNIVTDTATSIIIVEGEKDMLTLAMFCESIPVLCMPNGVQDLKWITNDWDSLQCMLNIYILTDNDNAGDKCAESIAKRLGMDRCYRLLVDKKYNDINECHMKEGWSNEKTIELLNNKKDFRPKTIITFTDLREKIHEFNTSKDYQDRNDNFFLKNFRFSIKPGHLIIITGETHHGKTEMANQMLLSELISGKQCAMVSLDQPDFEMASYIYNQLLGHKPTNLDESIYCEKWLDDRIKFVGKDRSIKNINDMKNDLNYLIKRDNVKTILIDGLGWLAQKKDYERQEDITEELKIFAKETNASVMLIHHINPTAVNENGYRTMNDMMGGKRIPVIAYDVMIMNRNNVKEGQQPRGYINMDKQKHCNFGKPRLQVDFHQHARLFSNVGDTSLSKGIIEYEKTMKNTNDNEPF